MNWIHGNEISWFLNGALIAISAANRKLRSNCEATVAAITSESSIKSYTAWSVFTIIVLLCYLAAVPPLLYTRLENKPGIYMILLFPPAPGKCSFSSLLTKASSFNGHTRHRSFFLPTADIFELHFSGWQCTSIVHFPFSLNLLEIHPSIFLFYELFAIFISHIISENFTYSYFLTNYFERLKHPVTSCIFYFHIICTKIEWQSITI